MKFALVNGQKQEAQKGLTGSCPHCEKPVIAHCGDLYVDHWSHKGKRDCDSWGENETEWHRAWKAKFPIEWQEVTHKAEDGEIHRADVQTDQDYILEFQRSHIKPEERESREAFYKKMIWIVDGTRRSRDKGKFFDELHFSARVQGREDLRILKGWKSALLDDWGGGSFTVFFDFGENILWGLMPKNTEERRYVFSVERNVLIASLLPASELNFSFAELLRKQTHSIYTNECHLRKKLEERNQDPLRYFYRR